MPLRPNRHSPDLALGVASDIAALTVIGTKTLVDLPS